MALIKCKECNKKVSDQATTCPHCGFEIAADNAKQKAEAEEKLAKQKAEAEDKLAKKKVKNESEDEVRRQKAEAHRQKKEHIKKHGDADKKLKAFIVFLCAVIAGLLVMAGAGTLPRADGFALLISGLSWFAVYFGWNAYRRKKGLPKWRGKSLSRATIALFATLALTFMFIPKTPEEIAERGARQEATEAQRVVAEKAAEKARQESAKAAEARRVAAEKVAEEARRDAAKKGSQDFQYNCNDNGVSAFVYSTQYVKNRMRAPQTAEFPSFHKSGVSARKLSSANEQCIWRVRAFVDAKNAYGGDVREWYTATMRWEPGGWYLDSLEFDQ